MLVNGYIIYIYILYIYINIHWVSDPYVDLSYQRMILLARIRDSILRWQMAPSSPASGGLGRSGFLIQLLSCSGAWTLKTSPYYCVRKMMELGTRIKFSQCSLKATKCFPADSREKIRLQSCLMCIDGLQAFAFSQSAVFSTGVGQPNEVRQTGSWHELSHVLAVNSTALFFEVSPCSHVVE